LLDRGVKKGDRARRRAAVVVPPSVARSAPPDRHTKGFRPGGPTDHRPVEPWSVMKGQLLSTGRLGSLLFVAVAFLYCDGPRSGRVQVHPAHVDSVTYSSNRQGPNQSWFSCFAGDGLHDDARSAGVNIVLIPAYVPVGAMIYKHGHPTWEAYRCTLRPGDDDTGGRKNAMPYAAGITWQYREPVSARRCTLGKGLLRSPVRSAALIRRSASMD